MSKAIAWCKIQQWYDSETPEDETIYLIHEGRDEPRYKGCIWVHERAKIFKPCIEALANRKGHFYVNDSYCEIQRYRIFDDDYVNQYKTLKQIDCTSANPISIYVCGKYTTCSREKHDVEPLIARVNILNSRRTVDIKICKCNTCRPVKHFIDITSLHMYQKKYGVLLFNYVPDKSCLDEYGRREASKIALYGYNTRQNGLSMTERHSLLTWLLDTKRMSYIEIKDHLEFLIFQGQNNPNHQNSISEWEYDLDFIANYQKNDNAIYNGVLCR